MDYFQRFLNRTNSVQPKKEPADPTQEFARSWTKVKTTLSYPDERQLSRGIESTDVPRLLKSMVDALVLESTLVEEGGTGACLEYLLKNDVLGTLVRLSESDRPAGIQAEVLRAVQNMVVLLDETFLIHSVVHRAVLRLLRNCVGDDIQDQLDGKHRAMGAAGNAVRTQPSEYEEDLVNLLCILCSRIRTYRELLMIFFHDKHWYRSEPLFSVEEEEEEEEDEEDNLVSDADRTASPTPSQATVTSAPASSLAKKTEYEFLLFNYLLRFVHREGKIGEFARAGLLFLMDVAMSPGGEPSSRSTSDEASSRSESSTAVSDPITDAALALAEYILDGDFSDVLGAGLSAVYSILPSKLALRAADAESSGGMTIGGIGPETEEEKTRVMAAIQAAREDGVEDAQNPEFKARLDHFLKLLEFLQDVLRRNVVHDQDTVDASNLVGSAIVQSILDAVRRIFMENVLYPHILECSDADGSAVAVMSYIEITIRTLQDGPLGDLLVEFLLSEDNEDVRPRTRTRKLTMALGKDDGPPSAAVERANKHRRRQSSAMTLLEMEAPQSTKQSEYFTSIARFTLKDLLVSNLRSDSSPTATAALHLLQSLLLQHPRLSIVKLLRVIPDSQATYPFSYLDKSEDQEDNEDTFRYPGVEDETDIPSAPTDPIFLQPDMTYSTHEREMNLYLTLVSRVDPSHNIEAFSTGYDHYLRDALTSILEQPMFSASFSEDADRTKHRLNVNDPILSLVLEGLRKFFSNSPDYNMALTGVLASLALHPDRSLAGWLTFGTNDSFAEPTFAAGDDDIVYSVPESDEDDRSIDYKIDEKLYTETNILPAASVNEKSRPVVHMIFHGLVAQLERYRQVVDNFDKYLLDRRRGLLHCLLLWRRQTNPMSFLPSTSTDSMERPSTPVKPAEVMRSASSAFVKLLTPKKNRPGRPSVSSQESSAPSKNRSMSISSSPFAPHYQRTESIKVEPFVPPIPKAGLWSPPSKVQWDEDDVFGSGWGDKPSSKQESDTASVQSEKQLSSVTLSQLLDNVVILEESIKELVAIIHARRSLGIDSIKYI
ncbi:Retinoic acid induced 16-like protein-domain-containing protein [Flagelloscypha sp. PMI_526]|nr:Retinoic acid induced 16-like protein-domain-containing protein [Flagelloscypha sp. PMI_526]